MKELPCKFTPAVVFLKGSGLLRRQLEQRGERRSVLSERQQRRVELEHEHRRPSRKRLKPEGGWLTGHRPAHFLWGLCPDHVVEDE